VVTPAGAAWLDEEPRLLPYQERMAGVVRQQLAGVVHMDDAFLSRAVRRMCEDLGDTQLDRHWVEPHWPVTDRYQADVEEMMRRQIRETAARQGLGLLQEIELVWRPDPAGAGERRCTATTYARPLASPA
jgi:hypothetical protein